MKIIKFFAYFLFLITITFIYLFFNLGNILDVTQKPSKSDVIVCLGRDGNNYRIKKAIELYNKNYSLKNLLILTGDERSIIRKKKNLDDKRIEYIKSNNLKDINIYHRKNIKSTKDEIFFLKNYLLQKKYSTAIIVSDTPHSKRIKVLINLLKVENDNKLNFKIIGTDIKWWKSEEYYTNKKTSVCFK